MRWRYGVMAMLMTITGQAAARFPLEVIEYIDDTRVVALVDPQEIEAAGTWEPLRSPPPLTMQQALDRVWKGLIERGVPPRAVRLASVELKEFRHRPGRWHYLVRLKRTGGSRHPRFFVVLMNGRTIAASQEPESVR